MEFEAIGTAWTIELPDGTVPAELAEKVMARIETFDAAYSRFRADSLVTAMAAQAGRYELPADAPPLLELYRRMYDLTGGAVTPLIGQVLSDAGYDAAYSLQPTALTKPPAWDDVLAVSGRQVTLRRPALLDFGAAGKGYLVDLVGEVLETGGIGRYVIDAGGDIRVRGLPQRIGLEHPDDPSRIIGVVELETGSLCGSAGNRRAWAGLHHIFDPRSLAPVYDIAATWVVADTALLADGLATGLFFVAPERLLERFRFEYVLVGADRSARYSAGFPGTLYD